MTASNLLAWSLQIGVLVLVAALASSVLQLRIPRARLFHWQMVLMASLTLPLLRPWKQEVVSDTVSVTTVAVARAAGSRVHSGMPLDQAALWLILAGILGRAAWLAAGFWRLRQYRRRSRLLDRREGDALLLSNEVASPVTFGALQPVVLLPAGFPDLDARVREAILCHELLHVRRRDWVFTVAEELVRALWWFHPAVWWLLGQIHLAREQSVDREVIARTQAREEYVDALLAMAGAWPHLELAPAPRFLRQKHLKQRVVLILKEVRMTKTRLVSVLLAALGVLAAACWVVTATFPLAAAQAAVVDSPGVSVELNGATLLHRTAVLYPEAMRQQGLEGTVALQVKIDGAGNVADAVVLSGPDELRKAALQSVLNWHFTGNLAGSTELVTIGFHPQAPDTPAVGGAGRPAPSLALAASRTIKSLNLVGLTEESRTDLLSRLAVHEGETLTAESLRQLVETVRSFDQHLVVTARPAEGEGVAVYIILSRPLGTPAPPVEPVAPATPVRIRVGGNTAATHLVFQPRPVYPPEAKQARIQGVVSLHAIIAKDGTVQNLSVISGDPLLAASALEAVDRWVYRPTLLNGEPVEVETEIDVHYTLAQ
jgi:TonB family protein